MSIGSKKEQVRAVQAWAGHRQIVSGFTTRAFGTMSARSDAREAVDQRYQALARILTIEPAQMFTIPQTHSNNVAIIRDRGSLNRREEQRGIRASDVELHTGEVHLDAVDFDMAWQKGIDGVILATADVFAVLLTADCAPVLFWDPVSRICGAAHIGLVGAVNQLAVRMVTLLQREVGVVPGNLEVAILPSIRSCHYNLFRSGVWRRLERAITATYGTDNPHYRNGSFDLPGFIRWQLESSGVAKSHIFDLGICTVCQAQDFFSHVQAGTTDSQEREGRFGSIIGMQPVE